VIEEVLLEIFPRASGAAALSLHLIKIPRGEFLMGSEEGLPFAPEGPVHEVAVASFSLGKFPVTQEQFVAVMKGNPSRFADCPTAPVDSVSWQDANRFCEKLSGLLARHVRLPTEAEWEYACRAGTTTAYHFGADTKVLPEYAWFELNGSGSTHPVGLKKPNTWGLHDMIGNVWEWCEDVWHGDYVGAPQDGAAWTANQDKQDRRSVRGGAWNMDAFRCRSAYRSYDWKDAANDHLGFRIVVNDEQ
jgi:formylglycine-generating enzyme required for sulfatase activity